MEVLMLSLEVVDLRQSTHIPDPWWVPGYSGETDVRLWCVRGKPEEGGVPSGVFWEKVLLWFY